MKILRFHNFHVKQYYIIRITLCIRARDPEEIYLHACKCHDNLHATLQVCICVYVCKIHFLVHHIFTASYLRLKTVLFLFKFAKIQKLNSAYWLNLSFELSRNIHILFWNEIFGIKRKSLYMRMIWQRVCYHLYMGRNVLPLFRKHFFKLWFRNLWTIFLEMFLHNIP